MVNISRKYLSENLKADAWRRFRQEIGRGSRLETALKKIFTPKEIVMIEKRLAILVTLDKGNSYLDIRRLLDVSPGTISFIKQGFKRYKRILKSSHKPITRFVGAKRVRRKFPRYKGTRGFGLSEW